VVREESAWDEENVKWAKTRWPRGSLTGCVPHDLFAERGMGIENLFV
jgi:hypothetical protein